MHSYHQHIFIVRAVEDGNRSLGRSMWMNPPQEIMLQIFGCRPLETRDGCSLGIHCRHHVVNRTVLTGGVEGLQHYQQRMLFLGVQQMLLPADALAVLLSFCRCLLLCEVLAFVGSVNLAEPDFAPRLDYKLLAKVHDFRSSLFC